MIGNHPIADAILALLMLAFFAYVGWELMKRTWPND